MYNKKLNLKGLSCICSYVKWSIISCLNETQARKKKITIDSTLSETVGLVYVATGFIVK